MKKTNKKLLVTASVVILAGGIAFLASNANQLQGRLDLNRLKIDFPTFECDRSVASVVTSDVSSEVASEVVSEVTSEVPSEVTSDGGTSIVVSEVTSEVSSEVPSTVTSLVPRCVPKKKVSAPWWKFWEDK